MRRAGVTLLTLLLVVAGLYILVAKPFVARGRTMTADFGGAGQSMTTSSPVKLRGVRVGRVSGIALAPEGGARLSLTIDRGIQVPDTVTASLEPESVFGPKFINLIPGTDEATGPFLADGAHISKTADGLDLTSLLGSADKLLSAIDPQDIAVIVDAVSQALGPSGEDIRGLIRNTGTLVDVGYRQRGRARIFLADMARLARTRRVGADLATLTTSSNNLLQTLTAGQSRGLRTAQGIADISNLLARGLGTYAPDLGEAFRSFERASTFVETLLPLAGPAIRRTIELLPVYKRLAWAPAPEGRRMVGVKVLLPSNPCQLLLGVCPNNSGGG
jgi:phospholipid/cholesterol/gamma-HCH transport system substrate-binding protein